MSEETKKFTVGPISIDEELARELGWSQDMISNAEEKLQELSTEATQKCGVVCHHCGSYNKRPKGGFECERDVLDIAQNMENIIRRIDIHLKVSDFSKKRDLICDDAHALYQEVKKLIK